MLSRKHSRATADTQQLRGSGKRAHRKRNVRGCQCRRPLRHLKLTYNHSTATQHNDTFRHRIRAAHQDDADPVGLVSPRQLAGHPAPFASSRTSISISTSPISCHRAQGRASRTWAGSRKCCPAAACSTGRTLKTQHPQLKSSLAKPVGSNVRVYSNSWNSHPRCRRRQHSADVRLVGVRQPSRHSDAPICQPHSRPEPPQPG